MRLIERASGRCFGPFLFPFFLYAECIWTAGRLGTATFGALFSVFPPSSFWRSGGCCLFVFFGFPLCRSVSRQEVQDGKVSRLLVFTFRFLHRGERREEEALRVPFWLFFVVVFCAFCVWVFCACCWPSVLQLVSLAFFSVAFFIGKG